MTRLDVIQGAHREECVAYRIVARRKGRTKHIGEVKPADVEREVARWQSAMRGWSVTAELETFRRWVSGGDEETPGRGGYGTAPRPGQTPSVPTVPTVPKETHP